MAILIKNAEVEKRARDLAALTGETLTSAIDEAVKLRLEQERAKPKRRPTLEEMIAATEEFRRNDAVRDHQPSIGNLDPTRHHEAAHENQPARALADVHETTAPGHS